MSISDTCASLTIQSFYGSTDQALIRWMRAERRPPLFPSGNSVWPRGCPLRMEGPAMATSPKWRDFTCGSCSHFRAPSPKSWHSARWTGA